MKRICKRISVFALLIILLLFQVSAASGDTTVYVTNTGEKYHSYGCQYLRKSCNSISLSNAVSAGYTRCSKCSPPYLDAETPSYSSGSSGYQSNYFQNNSSEEIDYQSELFKKNNLIDSLEAQKKSLQSKLDSAEQEIENLDAISDNLKTELQQTTQQLEAEREAAKTKLLWYTVIAGGAGLWLGYVLTAIFANRKINKLEKALSDVSSNYNELRRKTELRDQYIEEFSGKTCRELANVPDGVTFGTDHWPVGINGKSLVVFLSANKKKYHAYGCRYFDSFAAVNVYRLPKGCEPCKVCHPIEVKGTPAWVLNYQSYIETKKEHHIPDPDIPYPAD